MSNKVSYKVKICHMTDVHPQEDIRIFHKECVSLAQNGYEVYQISRGHTYESKGVHMIGVGEIPQNRFARMVLGTRKVYKAAVLIDADIYHIHDPELLLHGIKLKRKGKKVIFDSHEDVAAQIMSKTWIPERLRGIISSLYLVFETYAVKRLDAVIAATPHIAKRFKKRAKAVVIINNYPRLEDAQFQHIPFEERERIICYAGRINELRGEKVMIEAMKGVDGTMILAGEHSIEKVENYYD